LPLIVATAGFAFLPGFSAVGPGAVLWMVAGATLAAGPWYLYEALFNYPAFLANFVGYETLRRVTSHLEDDQLGSSFPLVTFASEVRHLWPLILPLVALLVAGLRNGLGSSLRRVPPAIWLWMVWLAVTLAAACRRWSRPRCWPPPSLRVPSAMAACELGQERWHWSPWR